MQEQRQSVRFKRPFLVTDYQDVDFEMPFTGLDVNLTGVSFWVPDAEFFLPGQALALRIRDEASGTEYELDSVEVIHLQPSEGQFICGCHITQVSSEQLLAHQRLVVMNDDQNAQSSMAASDAHEFDFNEQGSSMSVNPADYQQAGFALNLAVEEVTAGQQADEGAWSSAMQGLQALATELSAPQQAMLLEALKALGQLQHHQESRNEQVLALSLLAKMLVHTPNNEDERLSWQKLIRDFETRFLDERILLAYDLMHQGLEAGQALQESEAQIENSE